MTYVLIIVLALILAAPFIYEELRRPMSRVYSKGDEAKLTKGVTHYRWTGPEEGPIAVCIHGLTTPSYVFSGVTRTMAALGYRVLTYDLYGRGFSDRPSGAQAPAFFVAQLRELLADQGVTGRFTVVGYSMGGAIAAALAAREGKRIQAMILLAPAGLAPVPALPFDQVLTVPVIGDWLMRAFGGRLLRRALTDAPPSPTMIPDLRARQIEETYDKGYLPAVLSARRHTLSRTFKHEHELIRELGIPVLAIWGREDAVIPLKTLGKLSHINPEVQHFELRKAGHEFPQTHPSDVAEALQSFLKPGMQRSSRPRHYDD